jgi:Amt family ammonium transporter
MTAEWVKFGKPSVLGIVTGMVAGLATITPASGFVGPMGAMVLGVAGGLGCFLATQFMKRKLKIDDSLDVFPVHGVGGMIGLLLTAVFSASSLGGLGLDDGVSIGSQFGVQLLGILVTAAWCAAASLVLLKVIAFIVPLRVSAEEETTGLDLILHEERGYNI